MIQPKLFGDVPEPAEVMWHNRAVLTNSMGFGRKVQQWDQLDPNLQSFAHMAVASLVGCSWCLDVSYFHAHNEGLDEAKASEVHRRRESPVCASGRRSAGGSGRSSRRARARVHHHLGAG